MLPLNSTTFDARTANSNALLLLGKNGGQNFHPVFSEWKVQWKVFRHSAVGRSS